MAPRKKTQRPVAKAWDGLKLKKGDSVIYKNVGYGITSYEGPDKVIEIKDRKLFTQNFDRGGGMDWDANLKCWRFDSGLGLKTYAIDPNDPIGKREIAASA